MYLGLFLLFNSAYRCDCFSFIIYTGCVDGLLLCCQTLMHLGSVFDPSSGLPIAIVYWRLLSGCCLEHRVNHARPVSSDECLPTRIIDYLLGTSRLGLLIRQTSCVWRS